MDDYTPKTDEEIEWEELVYNAEKAEFERQQKKTFFEMAFGLVLEMSWKLVLGIVIFAVAVPLFLYIVIKIPIAINNF